MFSFKLDGVDSTSKGFKITRRPDIPSTAKDYEEHNIPGRDGALYEDLGTVQDIEIEVSAPANMNTVFVRLSDINIPPR